VDALYLVRVAPGAGSRAAAVVGRFAAGVMGDGRFVLWRLASGRRLRFDVESGLSNIATELPAAATQCPICSSRAMARLPPW